MSNSSTINRRELFGTRYAFVHHPNKLHGVLTELLEGDFDINKNRYYDKTYNV